jgi:uncharacterized protein (DUF2147 family)
VIIWLLFLSTIPNLSGQLKGDEILGNWITLEQNALVNCFKKGDKYFAKLLWYKPFDQKEETRKLAHDENTKYLNKIVMKAFSFNNNEWSGGEVIDFANNKTYSSFARINDKKQLKVTGFILFRWLSQSLVLKRIDEKSAFYLQTIKQ